MPVINWIYGAVSGNMTLQKNHGGTQNEHKNTGFYSKDEGADNRG